MNEKTLFKSAMLTLVIVVGVVFGFELYLRNQGVQVDYDDAAPLWADKRAKTNQPVDQVVVFIGSSRIKYDLDIPTWNNLTNVEAVQLAIEGSCPRPALEDLANDPNFKGKLVIDVTEGLFFSNAPPNLELPQKNVKYFHDRTPAQRASFELNTMLESQFVILDKNNYALNAQLDALELQSRPGVFMMPVFPMNFGRTTFERQAYMTDSFVADAKERQKVIDIWGFFAGLSKSAPPTPQAAYDAVFKSVAEQVNKIKARGGEVVFVRTPSSGTYYQGENKAFPRDKFWDRLLKETNSPGIHFKDYPAIANFDCPELSHLKKSDAVIFTKHFFELLSQQKGFAYLKNKSTN
jgi:hypothetical protein